MPQELSSLYSNHASFEVFLPILFRIFAFDMTFLVIAGTFHDNLNLSSHHIGKFNVSIDWFFHTDVVQSITIQLVVRGNLKGVCRCRSGLEGDVLGLGVWELCALDINTSVLHDLGLRILNHEQVGHHALGWSVASAHPDGFGTWVVDSEDNFEMWSVRIGDIDDWSDGIQLNRQPFCGFNRFGDPR